LIESIPTRAQRTNLSPRLDWALDQEQTRSLRATSNYRDTETNKESDFSVFRLRAYDFQRNRDTVQVSDTQVIGSKIVNETLVSSITAMTVSRTRKIHQSNG